MIVRSCGLTACFEATIDPIFDVDNDVMNEVSTRIWVGIQHADRNRRMITTSLKKRASQFSLKQLSLRLGLSLFQGG